MMLNVHFFGGFSKSFIILKMDEPLPNEGGEPPPNNGMKRELTVPKKKFDHKGPFVEVQV